MNYSDDCIGSRACKLGADFRIRFNKVVDFFGKPVSSMILGKPGLLEQWSERRLEVNTNTETPKPYSCPVRLIKHHAMGQ